MKKKIIKLWGVGMIVVLMASLFLVGGALPASAGTLVWSQTGMPGGPGTNQIAAVDASIVRVAPNGDIFVVDQQPVPVAADRIYKSVNGGQTWQTGYIAVPAPIEQFPAGSVVADLVVSPSYETDNTVFALVNDPATGVQVYRSMDGGLTFLVFAALVAAAPTVGTSIDVDPNYNNAVGGTVMVGTSNGALGGDVFTWNTIGFAWAAEGIAGTAAGAADIYKVAFSPSYGMDATILVVAAHAAGTGTILHHKVGLGVLGNWDPATGAPLDLTPTVISAAADNTNMAVADIAFPDGYNAATTVSRTVYVSISSGAAGDNVFRCYPTFPVVPAVALNPTNIVPAPADLPIQAIDFDGANTSGTLVAGYAATSAVYRTTNAHGLAGPVVWSTALGAPTPVAPAVCTAYPALSINYAADSTIYVGTAGGAANDESAVSVSYDMGANWVQIGLIDTNPITAAAAAIGDFQPYSATEWYMVTQTVGAPLESLWKTIDGGASWVRIATLATNSGTAVVRLSQNYAADSTMYFIETGNSGANAPLLLYSGDGGATWEGRATPAPLAAGGLGIGDFLAVDEFTLYIGAFGQANCYRSINAGWQWTPQALPLSLGAGVNQLAYDASTGHVLAGTIAGQAYLNSTGLAWAAVAALAAGAGNTVVAFDAGYSANSIIYIGDTTGVVAGLWRFTVGAAPPAAAINAVLVPSGIVCAPDGTLYVADATPAAGPVPGPVAGGIVRILDPTTVPAPLLAEYVSTGVPTDGLVAGATLMTLAYSAGSNVLYSIDPSGAVPLSVGDLIQTYTDTMSQGIPAVVSPAEGAIIGAGAAVVVIEPIASIPPPGGTYQVQWSNRADYLGAVGAIVPVAAVTNAAALAGVPNGATIYYRVQLVTPVLGPWSATMTFETQIAGGLAPNSPAIVIGQPAANGGTNVGLNPTFYWGGVIGASGYEFQLATDANFTDLIVDATGADALGNVLSYELLTITLDNSTTYYWRVKAISATSETSWSLPQGFTTMGEPVPTSPPVTITSQAPATITVDIPTPTQTTITQAAPVVEKVSEGYIYAIIIIGAVLVIAVIVLIVRTRRSV